MPPSKPEQARVYLEAGLRVLPVAGKRARLSGFGREHPRASARPEDFEEGDDVAILCGATLVEGVDVIGLDRDGEIPWSELEALLGSPLPPTLSSKDDHHRFYLVAEGHGIRQAQGLASSALGHFDVRCSGGYMVEPWQWDGEGFDLSRASLLPCAETLSKLLRRDETPAPTAATIHDRQDDSRDGELVDALACLWQNETTGHQAFGALGGVLLEAGVSPERAERVARELATATRSTHPNPAGRVLEAYEGKCPYGWPRLRAALEADGARVPNPSLTYAEGFEFIDNLVKASAGPQLAPLWDPGKEPPPKPSEGHGFQLISAAQMSEPIPDVDWVCRDLGLAAGRPAIINGYAGTGKTWAAQAIAIAVASGDRVFSHSPTRKGAVLHIDVDQGANATSRRYQQIAKGAGVALASLRLDMISFDGYLGLDKSGMIDPACKLRLARVCEGRALCIIDSLRGIAPTLDENSSAFGSVLQALTDVSNASGVAFLLLHHEGKPSAGRTDRHSGRGTSAIQDRAGAVWRLQREDFEESVRWNMTKVSEHADRVSEPFAVRLVDGEDVGSKVLLREEQRIETMSSIVANAEDLIYATLSKVSGNGWITRTALRSKVASRGCARAAFDLALKKMVDRQKIGAQFHGRVQWIHADPSMPDLG